MARYWQSSTFNGFFVEGNRQDRTLTEQLSEALEGIRTKEIIGAGFYIWLDKGDPKIRVKDLADRTLVELLVPEAPVKPVKKEKKPKIKDELPVEGEEGVEEAVEPEPEPEPEEEEELPPVPGELEILRTQIDEILGNRFERVDVMPPEMGTKLDLQLPKWNSPKAMAIIEGEPLGGTDEIATDTVGRRGGGITQILGLLAFVIAIGFGAYYVLTNQTNDDYFVYMPGTQFENIGSARGFINHNDELIIITVPTRADTGWNAEGFRFVRANDDSIVTNRFISTENDELRIDHTRGVCAILEPAEPLDSSTAVELNVADLQWNQNQGWQEFFATEINRAIVFGSLVRADDQLWLMAGDNFIAIIEWEFLTDEDRVRLAFAESESRRVNLEIQFIESLAYGSERTAATHRLFRAEIRKVSVE